MAKAIVLKEYGSSDVLSLQEVDIRSPGPEEILIRQTAIGVHFHDIYVRSGLYKTLSLPGIPGLEATGVVEAIGDVESDFRIGDRIGYVTNTYGAYTTHRVLKERLAVKLPDSLSDALVATNFSRMITVEMLTRQVSVLNDKHTILITAAAGGVGRLLCQKANSLGARVIGTVSTPEKVTVAKSCGCAHAMLYDQSDLINEVMDMTNGNGVDLVFDSVGAKTIQNSISVLGIRGHLVNFGQSSGSIAPLLMSQLAEKSLSVTRPILFHYIKNLDEYHKMGASAFKSLDDASLILANPQEIPLENVALAHKKLESGQGGGSIYLLP
ncbi:MAG: quinone oxidoreductase [Aestuariivita sp.]|nr:quinone oxidoreductase [Aestuariivita sp.]